MFAVGTEVVDKVLLEDGFAAVGIVKRTHISASLVEWPDGQQELVSNDELQEAQDAGK